MVVVEGLESETGRVVFALWGSAESYAEMNEETRSGRRPVEGGVSVWTVPGLVPADYAISLYHDVNDNGRLESNLFRVPKEPYGFSNDASGRFGPPKWDKVRFAVGSDPTEIRIHPQ